MSYEDGLTAAILSEGGIPPAVQLAQAPRHGGALTRNAYLTEPAWSFLWQQETSVPDRVALAARTLTTDQLTVVLETETREAVLRAALEWNTPNSDQWPLLTRRLPGRLNTLLWDDPDTPTSVKAALRPHIDVWHAIWDIAGDASLSDDDVVAALAAVPAKGPEPRWRAAHSSVAKALAHTRPGTIPKLVQLSEPAATAVAGAFTVDTATAAALGVQALETGNRYLGWALAANVTVDSGCLGPVVTLAENLGDAGLAQRASQPDRPVVSVTAAEGDELETLVRKCEPYGPGTAFKPSLGRPWNVLAVAANRSLDSGQKQRLRAVLELHAAWENTGYGTIHAARQAAWERLDGDGASPTSARHWVGTSRADVAPQPTGHIDRWAQERAVGGYLPPERTAAVFTALLGDDPDGWQVALDLLGNFSGTLRELCSVAGSLR